MFLSGTQQLTLQDAEGLKTHTWSSVRKSAISAVACVVICVPQQAYSDPPSRFFTDIRAGKRPSESTWVSGAPQLADLTQQPWFQKALVVGKRPSESTFIRAAPQLADLTQQADIQQSLVKSGFIPVSSYKFGLHTDVLAEAERLKSQFFAPAIAPVASPVPAAEYTWGSHAPALYSAEAAKSDFFLPAASPPIKVIGEFVTGAPQLADLTLQGTFQESLFAGARPTASRTILGGPLQIDLTQQADIAPSWLATQQGRVPPTTLGAPQSDPSQLAAQLVAPASPAVGGVPAVEYSWGAHAVALSAAEAAKSQLFPSARAAVVASPVSAFVVGTPPQQDLSLQAQFDSPGLLQGPVPPITVGTPQPDPSQIAADVWQPAITPTGSAAGAEYVWGIHAASLDLAESVKSQFFAAARTPPAAANKVGAFVAGAPVDPSQIAASLWQPFTAPQTGSAASGEYVWGVHAATLDYAESVKSRLFPTARTPTLVSPVVRFVSGAPQADSTQPPAEFFVPGLPQATVSPFMAGVSEVVDVVAQASFGIPVIPPPVGPVFGKFVQGAPQVIDLTLKASFSTSLILIPPATGAVPPLIWTPPQYDLTLQGSILPSVQIGGVPPEIIIPRPGGGDSARRLLRSRPLYYWEAAALKRLAQREVEQSVVEELAYAEATIPKSVSDFERRVQHLRGVMERLDSIQAYRDLARRVRVVVARMEESRLPQIAATDDTDEENEINDLIQFL